MSTSRRSFTLGSTFAFLTGTGARAQDEAPELPDCETKVETVGIWQVNASLRTARSGEPLGVNRARHRGDRWGFRRTTPGDDWENIGSNIALTIRQNEDDPERPDDPATRMFLSFPPRFTDANGTETQLIPFGLGATEITATVSYFVDIQRGDTRDRVADSSREFTVKADDRTHFISFDVPDAVMDAGGDQVIVGIQFSEDFGLGAIATLTGLPEAAARGERLIIRAKREVAAGLCQVPRAGGCFVVTAAHEAGNEVGARPVDLDLILAARDDLLASMPQYRPAANQYYDTAPVLVERINRSNHRHDIYARFVRRAVRPAEWFIRRGLPRLGFVWLGIGIETLYRRHMPDTLPPSAFAPGRRKPA